VVAAALSYCGSAKVAAERLVGVGATALPSIVYVSDFDLDASSIRTERGVLPPRRHRHLGCGSCPARPGARCPGSSTRSISRRLRWWRISQTSQVSHPRPSPTISQMPTADAR